MPGLFTQRPRRKRGRDRAGGRPALPGRGLRFERLEDRRVLSGLSATDAGRSNFLDVDPSLYDDSHILVRFRDDGSAPEEQEVIGGSLLASSYSSIPGLREIRLAQGVEIEDALAFYRNHPSVLYAEPNYRVRAAALPNDPYLGQLWGLHNTGRSGGTPDADIDAPEAWELLSGDGGTIVAVVDTGVDYLHPDLAASMWRNPGEIAGNGVDDDGNGFVDDVFGADFLNQDGDPMDDHGHGTHVAGTIAAVHNNAQGVAGVNPHARIMALKFLDASGTGTVLDAVAAIDYAVSHGAKISNHSWSSGGFSQALEDALERAKQAGHIVVAAAGNDGSNVDVSPSYPASFALDNVVAVAATDRNDRLAGFSNFGPVSVDLAAPGYAILSTVPGGAYDTLSGTSMATPHVAGVASLVWDQNPGWSYSRVIDKVLTAADPIAGLVGKTVTAARLNAAEALRVDARGPQVISSSPSGILTGSVASVQLTFNEPIDPKTFTTADVVRFTGPHGALRMTGVTVSETRATVSFARQSAPGPYSLVIGPGVRDAAGNAMDQDGDRVNGEVSEDTFTATFTIVDALAFTSDDAPKTIRDRASTVSFVDVGQDVEIANLDVWLDLNHTWDGDLRITLVGPGDDTPRRVVLSEFRGGGGDGYRSTLFDDEASHSVAAGSAPFAGSYRPEQPLSAFDGQNARGRWSLVIEDTAAFDEGHLNDWELIIKPQTGASTDRPPAGDAAEPALATGHAVSAVTPTSSWTTVTLDHVYRDMVVVASANYGAGQKPAVVRVRNAQGNAFQFQVVTPGGGAVDGVDVYYLVAEAGVYSETKHGIRMEAAKFQSTVVDRAGSWLGQQRDYQNTYSDPVVFGQVMTASDDWSVFWSRGESAKDPPSPSTLYLGRHVGEDNQVARAGETVGYMVFEAGSGMLGDLEYEVGLGSDTLRGFSDRPPFSYSHGVASPISAIVSQAGMDGLNGGWAVLFGNDPLGPHRLQLAIDEDQIRDPERSHITEQAAYIVFADTTTSASPELRTGVATSLVTVTDSWTTVSLDRSYRDMVVVATPNYGEADGPAVVRVRNAEGDSFQFQVAAPGGDAIDGVDVHYMVVEAGVYNETDHGIRMEAAKYVSTVVDRPGSWVGEQRQYGNSYSNPVVFGQVMTANDGWSVFWSHGESVGAPPSLSSLYVGRHIGEDTTTARASETVGYIVFEAGSGTLGDLPYEVAVGADTLPGMSNGPPYSYSHRIASPNSAIVTQTGMDGLNGGWALLYGDSPLGPNGLRLAIDEDQIRDLERSHFTEQAAYIVFGSAPESNLLARDLALAIIADELRHRDDHPTPADALWFDPVLLDCA